MDTISTFWRAIVRTVAAVGLWLAVMAVAGGGRSWAEAPGAAGQAGGIAEGAIGREGPMGERHRAILDALEWDEPPGTLNAIKKEHEGKHFMHSDELHPDNFRYVIENIGHAYVGIGTDQGYVFIGWQRPSVAFMVDYDPWVAILHKIYFAFFSHCDSSECLHGMFDSFRLGSAVLRRNPETSGRNVISVYRESARSVAYRLGVLRGAGFPNFMNNPDIFGYIKRLIADGRVVTMQANLLGDKAFASIARALDALGEGVGVLYLSNAEQYWAYTNRYRQNMLGLRYADDAVVLRTIATKPVNGDYRYSVQRADVFRAWLPKSRSVKHTVPYFGVRDEHDFPLTFDNALPPGR